MNKKYMREAIRLSIEMMRSGKGGPFGAVVVKGNKIVGRGSNQVTSDNDPTAHAEIVAIREGFDDGNHKLWLTCFQPNFRPMFCSR